MIHALHGAHTESARLEKIFKDELGDFTKVCGVNIEEIGESFTELVESFIDLDFRLLLGGSHSIWEMHDPETLKLSDFPFRDDKSSMKLHTRMGNLLDDGQNVDFIVWPRLRQWGRMAPDHRLHPRAHQGDWEGYDYDSKFVYDDPMAIASRCIRFGEIEEDEGDIQVLLFRRALLLEAEKKAKDEKEKDVEEQPQAEPERFGAT